MQTNCDARDSSWRTDERVVWDGEEVNADVKRSWANSDSSSSRCVDEIGGFQNRFVGVEEVWGRARPGTDSSIYPKPVIRGYLEKEWDVLHDQIHRCFRHLHRDLELSWLLGGKLGSILKGQDERTLKKPRRSMNNLRS